jgi:hypothetical protein
MSNHVRGLSNPANMKKLRNWMERNCIEPDRLSEIDITSEFGSDLSYSEAVELAVHKFPAMWRADYLIEYGQRPKQIIFVRDLIERILNGRVQVTYRKSPKVGTYYLIENRFKQKADSSKILIEFYQTDRVDPYKLSDEEAQLAGIVSAEKIRELFEKWYGNPIPTLYRNWFKIKDKPDAKIN